MSDETKDKEPVDEHIDDSTGILIEEFLKIYDPETGEVHYEGRA